MADDDREKTESPTSRRLEEAREQGNLAISKEVGTFFTVLGGLIVISFLGIWMMEGLSAFMKAAFSGLSGTEMGVHEMRDLFFRTTYRLFVILSPAFVIIPLFSVAAYLLQNGIVFSTKPLEPNMAKLDPISGAKKFFSVTSIAELFKSLLKIAVLGYVVYTSVAKEWRTLPSLVDMEVVSSMAYTGRVTLRILTRTVWVLAVIAVIDYAYQKWNYLRGLRMTKEEVKEEHKETEGDPLVRSRIRSIQRELARKRMMQDVPGADVVVTNPVHLAVALKYDRKSSRAPVVVAKGAGLIAERIKEIAREHDIPVVENKPLARSLFKFVEVGMEIPESLYRAVAEVLAYVYSLRPKGGSR